MYNEITYKGKIEFELPNLTKKHELQGSWKRSAMILLDGEICEYYAWFIKKRYNVILNKPLRKSHVTFINDRFSDVKGETLEDKEKLWNEVKNEYNGKDIDITLNVDIRTNAEYWWLNVTQESRDKIQVIREKLGLKEPYFGLHCTIGYATHLNLEHSEYIHRLIKNNLIQ